MMNGLRTLRLVMPVAGCALAATALGVSPTLAQQKWAPVVATTTGSLPHLGQLPTPAAGWEPMVMAPAEQSGRYFEPEPFVPKPVQVRQAPLRAPTAEIPPRPRDVQAAGPVTRIAQQQAPQMQVPSPMPVQAPAYSQAPSLAPAQPAPQQPAAAASAARKTPEPGPGDQYCMNVADLAADARFAWQKKTLGEIETELDRRIAILEQRAQEYKEWLARRDEFARKAQAALVDIYAKMKPDAAALQLAAMDEETAAAVLTKLTPRNASAILSEMPAGSAAKLTTTIAGAAKVNPDPAVNPAANGGKS